MIRPALPDEALDVSALIAAAYQDYVVLLGRNPQPMDDDYGLLIGDQQVSVLEQDGKLVGVLVCQMSDDHLLIRTVGIAPECQGAGLGKRLTGFAEELAKENAINVLRLYTNEVMAGNVEFYQRLGFRETDRKGPTGKRVIYMMKVLDHA